MHFLGLLMLGWRLSGSGSDFGVNARDMRYRIIQWGTGQVGKIAVRAIAEHPELELVGARVYDPAKVGLDAGAICGTRNLGVRATDREEELLARDADCVLWMGAATMFGPGGSMEQGVDELCRILASGKNVISIVHAYFIHPASLPGSVRDPVEKACQEAGVSFHVCGIDPGFNAEVLALTLTGLCRRVDRLRAYEILDYASYKSPQIIFDVMAFGKSADTPTPLGSEVMIAGYGASLRIVGQALGVRVDDVRFVREVELARQSFDVAAGRIEKGTVAAIRYAFEGYVAGQPRISIEHVTRLNADQAPQWPQGHGYLIEIEGEPPMRMDLRLGEAKGRDPFYDSHVATAMHAVHSVPAVCEARPGIATFLDLPRLWGHHSMRGE